MEEPLIEGLHDDEVVCPDCHLAHLAALGFCPECRLNTHGY